MAGLAEFFGDFLILVFTQIPGVGDSMALLLAVVLLVWSLWKSFSYRRKYHRPLILAVRERNQFLEDVTGGLTSKMSEARVAFAERFFEIEEV